MWVRFPEIQIEFYEHNALLKIGRAIGPVLHIDAHTANGARGRFVQMCIQVNLDKPLVRSMYLGKLKQIIQYEGVESLCFECGRIGHKKEECPFTVREPTNVVQVEQSMEATPKEAKQPAGKSHDDFGEWMIVTRHKPMSKARDKPSKVSLSQSNESSQSFFERTSPGAVELEKVAGKRKAPQSQFAVTPSEEGRSNKSHHDKSANGKSSKRSGNRTNHNQKAKSAVGSQKKDVGLTKDNVFVFGSTAGHLNINEPSQGPWILNNIKDSRKGLLTTVEGAHSSIIGNGNNPADQIGPNRGLGVVRPGIDASVEEHVSVNRGEQRPRLSSPKEQSLGDHAKSMVAIPHGQASGACPSNNKLKLIRDKVRDAKLGKISNRGRKEMGGSDDYEEEDSLEQTCGMLYEGEFAWGEDGSVCGDRD